MSASPTILLLSDSTVQSYEEYYFPQTGWGQVFYENFKGCEQVLQAAPENCSYPQGRAYRLPELTIENRAIGGRSSRSFVEEGKLAEAASVMKPGDYVFVQFGHNDATPSRPARYVPAERFAEYLKIYSDTCRENGALCVFVTPVARRNCAEPAPTAATPTATALTATALTAAARTAITPTSATTLTSATATSAAPAGSVSPGLPVTGEDFSISFPEYRSEMMRFAEENRLPLLDLGGRSTDYLNRIGREASRKLYLHVAPGEYPGAYADGVVDNTHLSMTGARIYSRMVAELIREAAAADPRLWDIASLLTSTPASSEMPCTPARYPHT